MTTMVRKGTGKLLIAIVLFSALSSVDNAGFYNTVCNNYKYYPIRWFDNTHCEANPDIFSKTPDIIVRHNYPLVTYSFINSQGYILTLYRIPSKNLNKPVVYLQHGLFANAVVFVDIGNNSLAFQLHQKGYDVWMGNNRGVASSKAHVTLSPYDPKFWDFNLDDLALVDERDILHFIANVTGRPGSIIYLGHSQGTALSYMYASTYPDEAQNLLMGIVSLCPIAYFYGIPLGNFLKFVGNPIEMFLRAFNITALLFYERLYGVLTNTFCNLVPWICLLQYYILFGKSVQYIPQYFPLYNSISWGSASTNQLVQFYQFLKSGNFQKYDYGIKKNLQLYGQQQPPKYNLANITLPIFLFYGLRDNLATQNNVRMIMKQLGSKRKNMYKIPEFDNHYAFNHEDFLYSGYLEKFFYPKLFQVLEREFDEATIGV